MAVSNLAVVVHGDVHVGHKYLGYREFIQQSATRKLYCPLFPVKDTKLLKNKKFLSYNRTSLGHIILHIIISSPQKKIKIS